MALGTPTKVSIGNSSVGTLVIDATVTEKHGIHVKTTEFPVEQGVNITDHKRRLPDEITITGTISNTPISDGLGTQQLQLQGTAAQVFQVTVNQQASGAPQNAANAYAKLNDIADANGLFTVTTELKVYTNMVLTDADFPRDVKVGDSLEFTLTFKNIVVVQNQTVKIVTRSPNQQPNQIKGGQALQPATSDQAESIAHAAAGQPRLDSAKAWLQAHTPGGGG